MSDRTYRTFNPTIDNPITRLDNALSVLDFLSFAIKGTATNSCDESMASSEQMGLAHLLYGLRREINDVVDYLDDNEVDKLLKCAPGEEREDEGADMLDMVIGAFSRKNDNPAPGTDETRAQGDE